MRYIWRTYAKHNGLGSPHAGWEVTNVRLGRREMVVWRRGRWLGRWGHCVDSHAWANPHAETWGPFVNLNIAIFKSLNL